MEPQAVNTGHAFISYVREDASRVDRVQGALEAAGIRVWRDTDDLWPGQDWKNEIRRAITTGSLAFIACFSEHGQKRETSYQNEELILAAEQMRLRSPGRSWLIPVRFAECGVPAYELGAGRTLDSLQRIDLFDQLWERGLARLVGAVVRTLEKDVPPPSQTAELIVAPGSSPVSVGALVKEILLVPQRQIELEDLITRELKEVRDALQVEGTFPSDAPRPATAYGTTRFLVEQVQRYNKSVQRMIEILVPGCLWGRPEHNVLWARTLQGIANANQSGNDNASIVCLQRFPALHLLYAAGLAAVLRKNFGALKSISIDATFRSARGSGPVIGQIHPWKVFENMEVVANTLALEADGKVVDEETLENIRTGRQGKRFTPVSDYLCKLLRPHYDDWVSDEEEYIEKFDELEVLLAMLASDEKSNSKSRGRYSYGPWYGSYTWRYRYQMTDPIEQRIREQLASAGESWPPLLAGWFDGSLERAKQAADSVAEGSAEIRRNQH